MSAQAFAELNARASLIGNNLMLKAIAESNIELIREMRKCSDELYVAMIEMVKEKPDFPTWHAALMAANRASPFNQYDTTGEFTKTVEELATIDASEHYFKEVAPLLVAGVQQFIAERAMVVGTFDQLIIQLIEERRDNMKAVD